MKQKSSTTDLTAGRPISRIFFFSIPLVLGTIFQQLYSFADTVIVGRCVGVDALAAVGATYSLHFLTLGFVQGTCVGFGIPIAQSFGARNPQDVRRYLWNGVWLCALFSGILSVSMTLFARPLLVLMQTPPELLSMAVVYIQVLFAGIPASVLYNFSASFLRAVGDSRHPFYFLLFSCVLNIALDSIFIVPFGMGVFGAALATVISQLVSGLLNCWWAFRKTGLLSVHKEELSWSGPHVRRLCLIGLPMGFEYSVSAVGAIAMQGFLNGLGSAMVAAQTAGEKIRQLFTLPMESVGMAMATYAGQNFGAGRLDRVKKGIRSGLTIQFLYCIAAWTAIFLFKDELVFFVLGENTSETALGAVQYLTLISNLFLIHGSLMIFRNTLQGLGYSVHAIVSGIGELIGRSLGGWLSVFFGFAAICYANPLAWFLAMCYCILMVARILRKKSRRRGAGKP